MWKTVISQTILNTWKQGNHVISENVAVEFDWISFDGQAEEVFNIL